MHTQKANKYTPKAYPYFILHNTVAHMNLDVIILGLPSSPGLFTSNKATSTLMTETLIIGHLIFHRIHDGGPTEGGGGMDERSGAVGAHIGGGPLLIINQDPLTI